MSKISNIAFDLGGVVLALSYENAVRRFEEIGLKDARSRLDAFCQQGIFGDMESGRISAEEFRVELGKLIGRDVTADECYYAWHGYVETVPKRNLDMLLLLRRQGYKVCLLSNTNPYMMQWAFSPEFSASVSGEGAQPHDGHPIDYYFDHLYLSYECKMMKPSPYIFEKMLQGQESTPEETLFIDDSPKNCSAARQLGIHTLCPQDNEDWIPLLKDYLNLNLVDVDIAVHDGVDG
jgi:putative hydrolase of the HAD superfamily